MIIALAAIWLTIVVAGLALDAQLRKLEAKIDRMHREVRDELRGER